MIPTEYDADIFYLKKIHIFLAPCIPASKFASLENNCCFFRTQLSHLWKTTATSLEHNRHIFGTQCVGHVERTVTILITTLWPF